MFNANSGSDATIMFANVQFGGGGGGGGGGGEGGGGTGING